MLLGAHGGSWHAAVSAQEKKTLRFSSYTWSGYDKAIAQVIQAWESQNPNVEVKLELSGGEEYWTKLQTLVAAGTPPDVGIADYSRTVSFAMNGVLRVLDDYVARDSFPLDQYLPASLAQYRWKEGEFDSGGEGGKIFGLPSDAQGWIFAYNKNAFDAAGLGYPTADWTWDSLVEAAQKLTNPGANKWGVAAPGLSALFRGDFVASAGGGITSPDFKKTALDAPETVEAFKWVWDLIYTHKVAPQPVPPGQQVDPFASGQVAMAFGGVWMIADWKQITDFGWDLALLPKHPTTGKRTTSLESDGWWVFSGTKEPDLAWNLCSYLASETAQQQFSSLDFVVPPSITKISEQWHAQTPPEHRAIHLEDLRDDSMKVAITFFDAAAVIAAVTPVLEKAFFDGSDIAEQLKEAADVMNQQLDVSWQKFG